jgi:cell wall assembly regulator SMI1
VDTVSASWARIDEWLQQRAPSGAEALAPPAEPAGIDAAEEVLGLAFPPALRESLLCHDGLREWANIMPSGAALGRAHY